MCTVYGSSSHNIAPWCRCVKWVGHPELAVYPHQLPRGGCAVGGLQHVVLRRPQNMVGTSGSAAVCGSALALLQNSSNNEGQQTFLPSAAAAVFRYTYAFGFAPNRSLRTTWALLRLLPTCWLVLSPSAHDIEQSSCAPHRGAVASLQQDACNPVSQCCMLISCLSAHAVCMQVRGASWQCSSL